PTSHILLTHTSVLSLIASSGSYMLELLTVLGQVCTHAQIVLLCSGKIHHALQGASRTFTQLCRHLNTRAWLTQALMQGFQTVQGHPGAVGAAFAGGALACRGCRQKGFPRSLLAHGM